MRWWARPVLCPGVHLPDREELRARGALGMPGAAAPDARRPLGAGGRADE
jgi:hypothetical protein